MEPIKTELRCHGCKGVLSAYDENGMFFPPDRKITCPHCDETWSQMFYITLFPYPAQKLEWYAHKKDGKWLHIFPSETQVKMCGNEEVFPVTLEIDRDYGDHHGWLDTNGRISMVWNNKEALKMCFTYGMNPEIQSGKGIPVVLSIKEGHGDTNFHKLADQIVESMKE